MNFSDLNIETKLKKSIELADFKVPTPLTGCKINEFRPMITRIDENHINNLLGN